MESKVINKGVHDVFSLTSASKKIDIRILYQDNVTVANPEKSLPSFKLIFEKLFNRLEKTGIRHTFEVYHSNAIIGNDDSMQEKPSVVISKLQVNVLFDEVFINNNMKLGLCMTLDYKPIGKLYVNIVMQGIVLACKNGLIIRENILEKNSGISSKLGFDSVFSFINSEIISNAIASLSKYESQLLASELSIHEENWIYGDILRRMHSKDHVVDNSILLSAVKQASSADNVFRSIHGKRTKFAFLQDFTYVMKTTEISRHIDKHIRLTDYILNVKPPFSTVHQTHLLT